MWKIPLFDIKFDRNELKDVEKVIRSGWLTMGRVTQKFEEQFARFFGVKHAIAASSGTSALHLANKALGIGTGDEVICPSLTFVATANSILYTGAQPIFADIKSIDDLNISADDIEPKITNKSKAILVVHYGGFACDMDKIMRIAKKHGLYVIEDCAHALGTTHKSKKCGNIGDIGCFSFYSNKNLTTAEGGMVTTNSDKLAKKIRLMRSHGMTSSTLDRHTGNSFIYDVVDLGFNYRIDEIRSSLGINQLNKLTKNNNKRKRLDRRYLKNLENTRDIIIPFRNFRDGASNHIFSVILKKGIDRFDFMSYLKESGIQTSIHYQPIHLFDFYRKKYGYQKGYLPITEEAGSREVTLPLYPLMNNKQVDYICECMNKYFKEVERK